MDVLVAPAGSPDPADVLLVSVGAMARTAVDVAARLADQGITATVVDPRWVKPMNLSLAEVAARHRLVVTVEDSGRVGGVGDAVTALLRDKRVTTPVMVFGLAQDFLETGTRTDILAAQGLAPQDLARSVVETIASAEPALTATDGAPA
jgi:1-deoxy-D-xylulose-5-phosphate synthase